MEPMSALLIATLPGLTDYGRSALPDAPVVPERRRRLRLRRVMAPSLAVARPAAPRAA